MNREYVIRHLREFLAETYSRPQTYIHMRREWFYEKSYEYWASMELLDYVEASPGDPFERVQSFSFLMDDLTAYGGNGKMFEVARTVALNVLDFLNALR